MLIRVWKEFDIQEVEAHLLIVGDVFGDCAHCKELGLEWSKVKTCPHCQTIFKYITLRLAADHGPEKAFQLKRIAKDRPDLIFLDYNDFKKTNAKDKAHRFFSNE